MWVIGRGMARPLRLEYAGAWYHVTGRGNERKVVFREDADRQRFVQLLSMMEPKFGMEIHGYLLMNNHYHLLVRLQGEMGLSAGMHFLGVSYTVWFNRRHRRSGHLFQGRYKAIIVDFERWGVSLSRYLHLNPVRTEGYLLGKQRRAAARLGPLEEISKEMIDQRIETLRGYQWSSLPAYCGQRKAPGWLHMEEVLGSFGKGVGARQRYRRYVEESVVEGRKKSPWQELKAGFVLGSKEMLEEIGKRLKGNPREQPGLKRLKQQATLAQIIEIVCRLRGRKWESFGTKRGDWGRSMVLLAARRHTALTNRELADWLGGKDDSTVAQAVRRLQDQMQTNRQIARFAKRLEKAMSIFKT